MISQAELLLKILWDHTHYHTYFISIFIYIESIRINLEKRDWIDQVSTYVAMVTYNIWYRNSLVLMENTSIVKLKDNSEVSTAVNDTV